ncbi:hypothetical protein COV11_03105 [Candidatus Woesearchaeota archaeon CG10_big_fil_rev_8_21_14_0_10_30_7]|nr:MAG: hypothetical protein COV11_03105 [Candidatus Woesearchaeota archaeon CG10_big_fil_rev_8_21_14_0_10_30_7]
MTTIYYTRNNAVTRFYAPQDFIYDIYETNHTLRIVLLEQNKNCKIKPPNGFLKWKRLKIPRKNLSNLTSPGKLTMPGWPVRGLAKTRVEDTLRFIEKLEKPTLTQIIKKYFSR